MTTRETVRLTREQLHTLVWTKPMTAIAEEFGMSSVAFAKYCKASDIPTPGRGYWQQLASGGRPPTRPLPKRRHDIPDVIEIERYDRASLGRRAPKEGRSEVLVPSDVTKLHPTARAVRDAAHEDFRHQRMLTVRGRGGYTPPTFKVGKPTLERAVRLLHAFFTEVERLGYSVRLRDTKVADGACWTPKVLEIVVDSEAIGVSLVEHLSRTPHVAAPREFFAPAYDLVPSDLLTLELQVPWGVDARTRWRDTPKARLEACVGEVVWVVAQAAESLGKHRVRKAEQERQAEVNRKAGEEAARERRLREEEEEKRRQADERVAAHQRWLHDDLIRMTNGWREAQAVRAFLAAVATAVPEPLRTPSFHAWVEWALDHAETIDPLRRPDGLAKPLVPTGA